MSSSKHTNLQESQQIILSAAENRFDQYGFNKTTMAEIAKDCNMSASNIYRFFENKIDIAASLACQCLDEQEQQLKDIVSNKDLSAEERLYQLVMALLHETHTRWQERPRMNEIVNAICEERMDIVDQHIQTKHAFLITLLREGVERNEFTVVDLQVTAEAISTALTLYDVPLFMPMFSLETFERKAKNVFSLILNGIRKQN
jgi:AcrR family transcriptional regulator